MSDKCECKAVCNIGFPGNPSYVRCDWCKKLEHHLQAANMDNDQLEAEVERLKKRLAVADEFCAFCTHMDSFDEHPTLLKWKELVEK